MRKILVIAALLAAGASFSRAYALDSGAAAPVVVTPVKSTAVTSTGQPITLPQKNIEVTASIFDIAPGATLPVHKHPFPRYGYVLSGTLKVTNVDTGRSDTFKAGDFIVEMIDAVAPGLQHRRRSGQASGHRPDRGRRPSDGAEAVAAAQVADHSRHVRRARATV